MYLPKTFQVLFLNQRCQPLLHGSQRPITRWAPAATYLSVSCHDQCSGSSGLRFATRDGQGGGQAGQQRSGRLQTELVNAGCCAGWRVRILRGGRTGRAVQGGARLLKARKGRPAAHSLCRAARTHLLLLLNYRQPEAAHTSFISN